MEEHHESLFDEIKKQIASLEERYAAMIVKHFTLEKDISLMQQDISYIREGQDKVTVGINKILWAIGLSLIAALTTFVIKGGLA